MRKKVVVTILAAFCVGLLVIWGFRSPKARNEISNPAEAANQTDPRTSAPQNQTSGIAQVAEAAKGAQSSNVPAAKTTSMEALTNGIEEWNKKLNRSIEFYGKVVDENERPIEGANVSSVCARFSSPAGSFDTSALSDTNGFFSLSVTGSALDVYVDKKGYYPIKSANQNHFNYTELLGDVFYPDRNNPIVFHLRKKGVGAELITSDNGIHRDIGISGLYNGNVKRVDFFNHQVGNEGQMELSAIKPAPGQPQSEWSFRLAIPDGGLIEENDEFPFEAPESGYTPEIDFQFRAGDTNWVTTLQKHFYIKFGQPPKYGWVSIDTAIDRGTILRYAVNPDGSRNLEPSEPQPQQPQGAPPGARIVTPQF